MPIQYGLDYPIDGAKWLKWDFFPSTTGAPVVVCIHGGGWISGDPTMMHDVADLLNAHGFAAACPQYRLAPLDPFPAAVEDVRAFVRFLKRDATRLGIDPDAIGAIGNSAGGHLATMLGVGAVKDSKVHAVVDVCGIADLTAPDDRHFPISHGFLEQFMGEPYFLNPDRWREASPIYHVDGTACPFLVIHGECDDVVPIEQSEALAGKLFSNGVPVEFHRMPNEGHAFSCEGWSSIEGLFIEFFRRTLKQAKHE